MPCYATGSPAQLTIPIDDGTMSYDHLDASVILCVRNGMPLLRAQLEALTGQITELKWELVVVDNGSVDDSAAVAISFADRFPLLRVVAAQEQASLAYARNVGASVARGAVLAFCDADDEVHPDWLDHLVRACPANGIAGGQLDFSRLNDAASRYWRGYTNRMERLPQIGGCDFAVGANFACRKATFREVGGCDPRFVAAFDDVDLSWRIQERGGAVRWVPQAIVDYRLRQDVRSTVRQQCGYGQAEVTFYAKHRPDLRRQPLRDAAVAYVALLRGIHSLIRGEPERGRWMALVAMRAGRLRGSIRNRAIYW